MLNQIETAALILIALCMMAAAYAAAYALINIIAHPVNSHQRKFGLSDVAVFSAGGFVFHMIGLVLIVANQPIN